MTTAAQGSSPPSDAPSLTLPASNGPSRQTYPGGELSADRIAQAPGSSASAEWPIGPTRDLNRRRLLHRPCAGQEVRRLRRFALQPRIFFSLGVNSSRTEDGHASSLEYVRAVEPSELCPCGGERTRPHSREWFDSCVQLRISRSRKPTIIRAACCSAVFTARNASTRLIASQSASRQRRHSYRASHTAWTNWVLLVSLVANDQKLRQIWAAPQASIRSPSVQALEERTISLRVIFAQNTFSAAFTPWSWKKCFDVSMPIR